MVSYKKTIQIILSVILLILIALFLGLKIDDTLIVSVLSFGIGVMFQYFMNKIIYKIFSIGGENGIDKITGFISLGVSGILFRSIIIDGEISNLFNVIVITVAYCVIKVILIFINEAKKELRS